MPQRFQRSRRKGARLPFGTVVVSRPTKWGIPTRSGWAAAKPCVGTALICSCRLSVTVEDVKRELPGRKLAFYCAPDVPCHADVLIQIAND